MAYRHRYVDPDSGAGSPDGTTWALAYTSLNQAEQAEDNTGDIRATGGSNEIVVFHCRASSGAADTAAVSVSGWTTDSGGYIVIVAEAIDTSYGGGSSETTGTGRHHGVWSTSHYRLEVTDNAALGISEDYVRVDGLQITNVSPTGAGRHVVNIAASITATTNDLRFSNLIIKGHGHASQTQGGLYCGDTDAILTVWNCLIYNITAIASNYAIYNQASASSGIYGCTLIGGAYCIRSGGTCVVKNTYGGGSLTEDFLRAAGTLAKTNCASEDSSADDTSGTDETQSNCIVSVDCTTAGVTFVDPANGDFRVADTDSALYGAGATLTDDPPGSTALGVDIIGTTRS